MTRWTTALGLALMVAEGGAAAEGTCGDWVGDPAGHVAACDAELAETKDPAGRVELLRDRGYAPELDGQFDRAEADYLEALRLRPGSAAVLADLAWLASARGDAAGRLGRAEEVVAAAPEDGHALNALAWALWEGERWEECLEVAACAVAADREDGSSASVRASCLAGAGRDAEALLAFDQAEALGDNPAWVAASRSASLERLGRLDEALEAARGALEIDPGQAWALRNLLRLEFAQGRPDAAVEAYEAFLPGMGTEAADAEAVRNSLAWGLFEAGRIPQARAVIEAWAADHPRPAADEFGAVDTLDTLGHVLAAAGEADRAAAAFAEAARLGGLEREAMYRAGLRRLGLEAGPGSQALKAALARCAAQGAACRIAPE